jgi:hypothetical protein
VFDVAPPSPDHNPQQRLRDLEHLRLWTRSLQHRLWLASEVGLGLDPETWRAFDRELAAYRDMLARLEGGAS